MKIQPRMDSARWSRNQGGARSVPVRRCVAAGVSPAVGQASCPAESARAYSKILAFPLSGTVWPGATEQCWPSVVWIAFTPQPVVVRHQPEGARINGQPFHHAYKRETAAI